MIKGVVKFQHLTPIQRVITINYSNNLIVSAVIVDCFINVLHCFFVLLIYDDFYFVFRNFLCFNVFIDKIPSFIGRFVINVQNSVVLVVLHKNRIEISEINFGFCVVVGGYDNAKGELDIFIEGNLIVVFVVCFFVIHEESNNFLLFAKISLKWGEFDFDVTVEINVVSHLGQKNCSKMGCSIDLEECSISLVNIL